MTIDVRAIPSRAALLDDFAQRGIEVSAAGRYSPDGAYFAAPVTDNPHLAIAWFFDEMHGIAAERLGLPRIDPVRLVIGGVPFGADGPAHVATTFRGEDGARIVSYNSKITKAAQEGMLALLDGAGATASLARATNTGVHEGSHLATPMQAVRDSDEAAIDLWTILQTEFLQRNYLGVEPVMDAGELLRSSLYIDMDNRMFHLLDVAGVRGGLDLVDALGDMVRSGDAARTGAEMVAARHGQRLDDVGFDRFAADIDAWIGGAGSLPEPLAR